MGKLICYIKSGSRNYTWSVMWCKNAVNTDVLSNLYFYNDFLLYLHMTNIWIQVIELNVCLQFLSGTCFISHFNILFEIRTQLRNLISEYFGYVFFFFFYPSNFSDIYTAFTDNYMLFSWHAILRWKGTTNYSWYLSMFVLFHRLFICNLNSVDWISNELTINQLNRLLISHLSRLSDNWPVHQ